MSEIADDKMLQIRSPLHICPNGESLSRSFLRQLGPNAALLPDPPHPPPVAFVMYLLLFIEYWLMVSLWLQSLH